MGPIKWVLLWGLFNNLTLFFFKESIPRNKHFMLILYITRKFFII